MDSFKKLINEVKKHEILYTSQEEYNNEEKHLAWEEVGRSTNMTGERARKKWENIHSAYISSKTSGGSTNKFASLLGFLETCGNRTFSTLNESSAGFLECPKGTSFTEQTSTPKSRKRKREIIKSPTEEADLSQISICESPPAVNMSTTSVAAPADQDDVDCFCNLVATRMRMLPDEQIKKSKRQILEILHRSEIESL